MLTDMGNQALKVWASPHYEMLAGMKLCTRCSATKPISEYRVQNDAGSRRTYCDECLRGRLREKYKNSSSVRSRAIYRSTARTKSHPTTVHHRRVCDLKRHFGITVKEYDTLLAEQGGRCAICGSDHPGRVHPSDGKTPSSWSVDHCHKDGRVRGLLCMKCNVAIGYYEKLHDQFGENAILDYLTRPSPLVKVREAS